MSRIYDALKKLEQEREVSGERARQPLPPAESGALPSDSREEDDYRRLRASLLFTPTYAEMHTILVTATRHGEGTTRVALGLAAALAAEPGARVLMVEANLRSPALATRVPGRKGPGLSDYLAGQVNADALVTRLEEVNLSIVHAGAPPAVVDCEAIASAIERLQSEFDFVIVDAPPVNSYADVTTLAPRMDGTILVVEADKTPVGDAEAAKRSLERVGSRIYGVVLNRRKDYVPAFIQSLLFQG